MAKFADNFEGWYKYAERARARPPRTLLIEALDHVARRDTAIDIGSGALNDVRYLLDAGFAHVTALDGEPIAQDIAATLPQERFAYVIAKFEDYAFAPDAYDLFSAQYALPFIKPAAFERVFSAIIASLKPGGIIAGQFFGDHDDWVGTPDMTFHSADEVRALLAPLTVLSLVEEDNPDSKTLNGVAKHWHLFSFIARRH